ncbi:DUF4255 domain-containing protein [Pedobacter caeni]|uniref:Pvc16 N-terminal domain-containing protein n=1 Tax=Pedobacter caeni TaxID=288992 RepID=A0A1M4U3T6_9SPHI|nr:DUF4255 domain-containing protein [Pedobacter caeni]SHE51310.1 Protein of unknown function [Pedobacter caeni]
MIDNALILLKSELTAYLVAKGDNAANVIIDNIGLAETTNGASLIDNVVITLVNIEEESTLKNQSPLKRFQTGSAVYENAPVCLNLYVLMTCNYFGEGYLLALKRLSMIIQFLQSKNSFSSASASSGSNDPKGRTELKFTMELYTLTFEQINHLWGSLGGRQVPFAMYKLRLVAISEHAIVREVPLIEEIETNISTLSGHN